MKSGPWLKLVGYSDSLGTRVTKAITNHVLIKEYWLRFFSKDISNCLYGDYPIESKYYFFQCDMSCDHSHIPLHCPRNKI